MAYGMQWMKLQRDFFSQAKIKKLRRIAGGDTYTIIYLKLQLLSIENEGKVFLEGVESDPADELALIMDEDADNVRMTLSFLEMQNMVEYVSEDELFLPEAAKNIGKQSDSAERTRRYRARLAENKAKELAENSVCDVTSDVTSDGGVTQDIRYKNRDIREKKEEKEKEKEEEYQNTSSCAERKNRSAQEASQTAEEPVFISLLLNNGDEYPIPQSAVDKWKTLYPAVDVEQELRGICAWCDANPTRRKTKSGILRFVNSWLGKAQNNGGIGYADRTKGKNNAGRTANSDELGKNTEEYFEKHGIGIWI